MKNLSENTKVILNLGRFASIIIMVVGFIFLLVSWKSDIEFKVNRNSEEIIKQEEYQKTTNAEISNLKDLMIEVRTDVKWLIEDAKEKE